MNILPACGKRGESVDSDTNWEEEMGRTHFAAAAAVALVAITSPARADMAAAEKWISENFSLLRFL